MLLGLRRQDNPIPVLVLAAPDAVPDRVKGLDSGADDYVVKPFEVDEISGRIRTLLRRCAGRVDPVIAHGELTVNVLTRQVMFRGQDLALSAREFAVLKVLFEQPPQGPRAALRARRAQPAQCSVRCRKGRGIFALEVALPQRQRRAAAFRRPAAHRDNPWREAVGVDPTFVDIALADKQDSVGREHPVARRDERTCSVDSERAGFLRERQQKESPPARVLRDRPFSYFLEAESVAGDVEAAFGLGGCRRCESSDCQRHGERNEIG